MSQLIINVGAAPNDGLGDPIRNAFIKCNDNFTQLFARYTTVPTTLNGIAGDVPGMYADDSQYFYYCFALFNGATPVWAKIPQEDFIKRISNGTSSINIPTTNGNILFSVNSVSNVATVTTNGITVTNLVANSVSTPTVVTANAFSITSNGEITLNTSNVSNAVNVSGSRIINVQSPVNDQDAATKVYVDSTAQGLSPKASCVLSSTTTLPAYTFTAGPNSPTDGVGDTLTAQANGVLTLDGVQVLATDRVLIKSETAGNAAYNGIYVVAVAGNVTTPWQLIRSTDFDVTSEIWSAYTFIQDGLTNADSGWTCTNNKNASFTWDTTPITWTQFSGAGSYSSANGIILIGTQFSAVPDSITTWINTGVTVGGINPISVLGNAVLSNPTIGNATFWSLSANTSGGNGNITANNLSATGNVAASAVATDGLYWSNGTPIISNTGVITLNSIITTGNANIGGNILAGNVTATDAIYSNVINGATIGNVGTVFIGNTATISGNVDAGNVNVSGLVNAVGNINTATSLNASGANIGNATIGNLSITGSSNISGNVNGLNLTTPGNVVAGGNAVIGGNADVTGNVNGTNTMLSGLLSTVGNITTSANVNANNATITSNVVVGGNTTSGNIASLGNIDVTGNINGSNVLLSGLLSTVGNISTATTSNVSTGNLLTSGQVISTGNVTGANLNTGGTVNAVGNIDTAASLNAVGANIGNATIGNLVIAGTSTVTGNIGANNFIATNSITAGANITTTANLNANNATITSNIVAGGNITSGNISSLGAISASGNISGNNASFTNDVDIGGTLFVGNIIPAANVTYTLGNSTRQWKDLWVSNATIYINSIPLTMANSSVLLWNTVPLISSVTDQDLTTAGNIKAGNLSSNGLYWGNGTPIISNTGSFTGNNITVSGYANVGGNVIGANFNTGGIVNATGNINTAASLNASGANIGNATIGGLTITGSSNVTGNVNALNLTTPGNVVAGGNVEVTGNINGSNALLSGILSATGNVSGANFNTSGIVNATGNINTAASVNASGANITNATLGNATIGNLNITGSSNNSGNINALNLTTPGNVVAGGNADITGNVNASNALLSGILSATGNVAGANFNTSGIVNATGNINTAASLNSSGANIGNATIGNLVVTGVSSVTGNATAANFTTSGNVTADKVTTTTGNFGNIGITGNVIASADPNITIDPNSGGNTVGTVFILGNLQVSGNITTVNSNTITIDSKLFQAANNAPNQAAADGGGLAVGPSGNSYASWTYSVTANSWVSSLPIVASGGANVNGPVTNVTTLSANGAISTSNVVSALSFVSTIATGNAPFTVASSTVVANLNANLLNGLYATSSNVANTIVSRDVNGSFGANVITVNNLNAAENVIATGNVTGTYFLGNGALLTGVITSVANINSGNSNVTVTGANANIAVSVGGVSNVAVFTTDGEVVTGNLSASANISASYFLGNGRFLTGINNNSLVNGTSNITIPTANSNAYISINGTANVGIWSNIGAQITSLSVGNIGNIYPGVDGEIRATNNITGFYSSDQQFKENVANITNALEKVNTIGGKTFDWTDSYIAERGGLDDYFLRKHDLGVIAQDVQKVLPEAVRERPDGSLAVDYPKLSALAFAAINELSNKFSQEIAELRSEIEQLKGK